MKKVYMFAIISTVLFVALFPFLMNLFGMEKIGGWSLAGAAVMYFVCAVVICNFWEKRNKR